MNDREPPGPFTIVNPALVVVMGSLVVIIVFVSAGRIPGKTKKNKHRRVIRNSH